MMTSPAAGRGIFDIAKLAALYPRVTRVKQRLPTSFSPSFRYHVPTRIPSPHAVGGRCDGPGTSPSACSSANSPTQARFENTQTRTQPLRTTHLGRQASKMHVVSPLRGSYIAAAPSIRGWYDSPYRDCHKIWERQSRSFSTIGSRRNAGETGKETSEETIRREASGPKLEIPKSESPAEHTHLMDRFHMPQFHRPTKEELLAAATGFWSRLRVRFKWFSIRSVRPFNADEIGGFITWILLGHVVWIIVGTTTFFSLAIFAINTVFAQETLATWIGNYLTKSTGLRIVFESAVVPRWGDGVITFKNVFVSRRPGQGTKSKVTKGSPEAAAAAAAEQGFDAQEDTNYTQFDITLGEVNVTLSFRKWWNSKGLLHNVEVKHVRGVVDRTHVHWTGEQIDPKSYRHEHSPGDFEIDQFKVEDLLVTVHQPNSFRPFPVSIYSADLPRLRKQWLFYDMLSANSVTGEYDRSLFTIHPRQTHAYTGANLGSNDENEKDNPWKKQSRIRIDGMNVDHLNRGAEGPFSWIHEGNVDIVADILIPADSDESVLKVISNIYDRMEAQVTSKKRGERLFVEPSAERPDMTIIDQSRTHDGQNAKEKRYLVMDLRVHLNDVRAVVPLFTKDLSYVNNALIRPIVAYINSRRTFIPVNCRVVKETTDFDGSWTVFDSGLMDDLSAEVYDAFARDVTDEQARMRRFKKVGLWSLQLAVQAIFMGMAGNVA